MPIESATYIQDLNDNNPDGSDDYATADDHLRLIKGVLQNQFTSLGAAAVTATAADLNLLAGAQAAGLSAAELLFVNGVTSAIQTQLDNRSLVGHTHTLSAITDAGTLAALNTINGSLWSGTDLAIADGGTNASSASAARSNLGLAIGSDVQAFSAALAAIAGLSVANSNFIVGNGSTWVAESGATARTSLGLGSLATQSTINNADWSGTDLALTNGGTGSSSAAGARTNLGIGSIATRALTVQNGGSPTGGADGDVFFIW